jgi:hypothetical protein
MVCWKIWGFWNSLLYKIVLKAPRGPFSCTTIWVAPWNFTRLFHYFIRKWVSKSSNFPTDHQSFSRLFLLYKSYFLANIQTTKGRKIISLGQKHGLWPLWDSRGVSCRKNGFILCPFLGPPAVWQQITLVVTLINSINYHNSKEIEETPGQRHRLIIDRETPSCRIDQDLVIYLGFF